MPDTITDAESGTVLTRLGAVEHRDAHMTLTTTEKIALAGLSAQWQQRIAQQQTAERELLGEIETRLGLPVGSIGKTHSLDVNAGVVTETPKPPPPPPEE